MTRGIRIPYGRGFLDWQPPPDLDVTLIEKAEPSRLDDPLRSLNAELDRPLDSEPLEALGGGRRSATIVVTDSTRPCPDHRIVPALAERLIASGVPESGITILIAIGMHRPSTRDEKIEKLGAEIVARFRVLDSSPLDPSCQLNLGTTPDGTPVSIDRRAVETDLLLATGIVEPHQYAGFSGGWKTVGIGTASSETISSLHGMRFLEHPRVRLGSTKDNPFLDALRWIGERAGLRFVVNVALDSTGEITQVRAGNPESVHRSLSRWVRERAIVPVEGTFPIVVGAAGHPKDSNLYQATRIPTYLCFGARPAVRRGGTILVPAACPEGAGAGPGEKLFFDWLSTSGGPGSVLERARRDGYPAGGQRAVMVAWAQEFAEIGFVGTQCPEVVRACGLHDFGDLNGAIRWACERSGDSRVLVVPRALTTLPEVRTD